MMKLSRILKMAVPLVVVYSAVANPLDEEDVTAAIAAEFPVVPVDDGELMKTFSSVLGDLVDEHEVPDGVEIGKLLVGLDEHNDLASVGKVSVAMPGRELRPAEIYQNHIDATLMFGSVYKCGRCDHWHTGATASAWVLDTDGIIVSNYHVVDGDDADKHFGVATRDGEVFPVVEVLAANKDADVSVLRVDTGKMKFKSALQLGAQPDIGKDVVVLSNPKRRFFSLTKGYVSRYFMKPINRKGAKIPQMTITADYAVGSSGGPVLDLAGNVVGMVRSTQTVLAGGKDKAKDHPEGMVQMVFKDCVPVAAIRALLDESTQLEAVEKK